MNAFLGHILNACLVQEGHWNPCKLKRTFWTVSEESNQIYVLFFPSLVNIQVCTFAAHNSGEACRHLKVSLTLGKILARLPLVSSCVTMPCCPMCNPPITLPLLLIVITPNRSLLRKELHFSTKTSGHFGSTWPLPLKTQVCLRHLCLSAFFGTQPVCLPTSWQWHHLDSLP